jgi:hypothetical protein
LKSIGISQKESEFFPLTDFVPYRGHRDNKKIYSGALSLFYIFLLSFQNITSVVQKNYKNLFLDFFFELFVAISKMAFLYIFKNGKYLCKT